MGLPLPRAEDDEFFPRTRTSHEALPLKSVTTSNSSYSITKRARRLMALLAKIKDGLPTVIMYVSAFLDIFQNIILPIETELLNFIYFSNCIPWLSWVFIASPGFL